MSQSPLAIGVDYGSDSVRSILMETETGHILSTAVFEYPRWKAGLYSEASKQQFRQHPLDYLEGLEHCVKSVLKGFDSSRVAGLGIDTTGSTPCAVDEHCIPLALHPGFEEDPDAMFVLWKDHTALAEADEINCQAKKYPVDYLKYCGGVYSGEWFFAKVLHLLRHNAKVRENAYTFVEHGDWLAALLTGCGNPAKILRNRCAAGHKALWNSEWNGLPSEEFLGSVDPLLGSLRKRLYSETYPAGTCAGSLCPEWAEKLGLPQTVKISVPAFDAHLGAVGAGIEPGGMVTVYGTSKVDLLTAKEVSRAIPGICGQVDGSIIPGYTGLEAGQAAFGDAYAWFKNFLKSAGSSIALPELEKRALALPLDPDGPLVADWFNGRRTPDANEHLKAAIFGLDLGTKPEQVYRAIVEGTCCGMRAIAERFEEYGLTISSIRAAGGIAKKSPLVMQCCADILQKSITIAESDQVCAIGAAITGAVAAGVYPDIPSAVTKMASPVAGVYTPNPVHKAPYERLYRRYCRYCRALEQEENEDKQQ